jgi:DAACS family dicarboxylate/amino acid:cation (Na+ or H+) symporter
MPRRLSTHNKIFIGMLLGIAAGAAVRYSGLSVETIQSVTRFVRPVGDVFMRMLFMTVMPLLLSALTLGIAEIGDIRKIGRVGLRTLVFTVAVSSIAVLLGVALAAVFRPGSSLSESSRRLLIERYARPADAVRDANIPSGATGVLDALVRLVPKNPLEDMARAFDPSYTGGGILAVIFFAFMLGIALALSDPAKTRAFRQALEGLY